MLPRQSWKKTPSAASEHGVDNGLIDNNARAFVVTQPVTRNEGESRGTHLASVILMDSACHNTETTR